MNNGQSRTAVILAAGLGTRLRPLTYQVPKPLVPILNRPLLGLILEQLAAAGFRRVAVNTHHHGEAIGAFVASQAPPVLEVVVRHEPEILGTGGALKNLADFLGSEPFLVINGDIIADIDLTTVLAAHAPDSLATLLLHHYPRFNTVWLDAVGCIQGFGDRPLDVLPTPLAFTGIQVVSPRLLDLIPAGQYVNIIDTYRQAIAAGGTIQGFKQEGFFWRDVGTPADYLDLHVRLLRGQERFWPERLPPRTDPYLGPGVRLGRGVHFGGGVCLGPGVQVGDGVSLTKTVVWAGAVLAPHLHLEECIIGQQVRVAASARGRCLVP
jgi:mannose-1-phosphate guanylyltransferase